jgi:hypothetical protein
LACAAQLRAKTWVSRPPTISKMGAVTAGSRGLARSGRPPRETIAAPGPCRR